MPRADRVKLDPNGLDLPPVDHLSNNGSLNVILDRVLAGGPTGFPQSPSALGLLSNFVRLVDKSLREYDAARAELTVYVEPHEGTLRTSPYIRAVDHMENCVGATHRSVLNAKALRELGVGRGAPRLTDRQESRLAHVRHAIEHSDEKLLGKQKFKSSPPFNSDEPYSLRLANTSMVIGRLVLTYQDLHSAITKMYRAVEKVRGVSTGISGPNFPNATLRTTVPPRQVAGNMRASDYMKEVSRLSVNH
ncbi:MAG: hypothetical protein ACXVXP_02310 [Mycobacteriaceae bacterium]